MDERAKGPAAGGRTANQLFKDQWENRVAMSTTGAVVFHAALILWAGWQIVLPIMAENSPSQGQLTLLPPSFAEGSGFDGTSTPMALEEEDAPEAEPMDNGGLDGSEVGGAGTGTRRWIFGQRLLSDSATEGS